ncbi:peptidoglycan-binding protein [Novosphingobium sp. BL-8H]|uniref:peptidoglycan-binding protein n=1 Tax=Novosphingobium sp. BL-8H TaxID=3127640 RepID=UPI003757D4CB
MSDPVAHTSSQATQMRGLDAAQKARVIYTQARSEMSDRLWRAALGDGSSDADPETGNARGTDRHGLPFSLEALIGMLEGDKSAASPLAGMAHPHGQGDMTSDGGDGKRRDGSGWGSGSGDDGAAESTGTLSLGNGPNARYAPMLGAAASRTGLPAPVLATIVHAEAAKDGEGRWMPYSRNPRSSAAGLGQFLSGTWEGEAEREGTWLNATARANGWLDDRGHVRGDARAELLSLRYDPQAAIETTADYARANLDGLRRAGVRIGEGVEDLAKTAYIGHHLGRGDAVKFLTGSLDPARARRLLDAQIGSAQANRRIEAAGSAVAAHRSWLMDYVGRTIKPAVFAA